EAARDHHGQRTRHEEHAEGGDKTRDGEADGDEAVDEADDGANDEADQNRGHERHAVVQHDGEGHRHQRKHRTDGKIELAADHQDSDADGDEAHLGKDAEDAAKIVAGEKDAVRARMKDHGKNDEEHDCRELGLLHVDLQEATHGVVLSVRSGAEVGHFDTMPLGSPWCNWSKPSRPLQPSSRQKPGSIAPNAGSYATATERRIPAFAGMTEWVCTVDTNTSSAMAGEAMRRRQRRRTRA